MIQNRSRSWTSVRRLYGVDSQALTMTLSSSSGAATGRCPSRNRRVKKLFQDVKPQCGSAGSCSYCSIPTVRRASSLVQPVGLSFRTYSDGGLLKNPYHSCRIALSAALTRGSRNAAYPAGVPIAQSSTPPRGRVAV